MRASRRRARSLTTFSLIALLALAFSSSALGVKTPRAGSSCTHPIVVVLKRGQQTAEYQHRLVIQVEPQYLPTGAKAVVGWWGLTGFKGTDIICSANIQRRDGSWVAPTRLRPYATPTPTGGEYVETSDPATQYRQVVVKFAKPPVPVGSSCDYPLLSRIGGTMQQGLSAAFRVGTPHPGLGEVAVTVSDPNTVVCRVTVQEAVIPAILGAAEEFIRSFPITIGEHGGLSSPVPLPSDIPIPKASPNFDVVKIYTRYLRLPKPSPPKLTHGCTLETSGGNTSAEIGDTKDFGVKTEALGHPTTGQSVELVAVITIHKPSITICSATLTGMVPIPGAFGSHGEQLYREVTYPMSVSLHGGRSHPVTVPWEFYVPQAHVKARRG
jgi:hypothetical protein